jgi:hypothetical protein
LPSGTPTARQPPAMRIARLVTDVLSPGYVLIGLLAAA